MNGFAESLPSDIKINRGEFSSGFLAKKIARITADYRRSLQTERVDIANQFERAGQDLAKQEHRHEPLGNCARRRPAP